MPVYLLVLLSILLLWIVVDRPYKNSPPIRSDGVGYHIWVYGFKNMDFTFCKYKQLLNPTGSISVVNDEKNICGIKYPPGVGMFQFPFVAFLLADKLESKFTKAENIAVLLLAAILLALTMVFSFKSLELLGSSPSRSLIAISAFSFGSGLFHYGTYDASFSHIYSAFGCAALLLLVIKSKKNGWTFLSMASFALVIFWLYLVRQTNGAITLAILAVAFAGTDKKYKLASSLAWVIATGCGILIQLAYNYYVTGEFKLSSYGQERFLTIGGNLGNVLVSYEAGLFTYYPIYLLTVLLGLMYFRNVMTYIFIALVAVFAIVYGSWHAWQLGGGMGHRGFVELAPIGSVVLGMSLNALGRFKLALMSLVILFCCYVTTSVMVAYWKGSFPFFGADSKLYWSTLVPDIVHYKK